MTNPYAGEVALCVDGKAYACKLTLGALAQIEADLKAESLMDLIARFEGQTFKVADILTVVCAGLRSDGWEGTHADLMQADIKGGPMAAARAAAQMLTLAFQVPD